MSNRVLERKRWETWRHNPWYMFVNADDMDGSSGGLLEGVEILRSIVELSEIIGGLKGLMG